MERVYATYLVETPYSLDYAAAAMAGEQSTGTFTAVPGETRAVKEQHQAHVISIESLETMETPSLETSVRGERYQRGRVTLSFPFHNIGASIPQLLATVAGNLYELRELTGLRLEKLVLSPSFYEAYQGPQFSVAGTRAAAGVVSGPISGTIIKPSVGLREDGLRTVVRELAEAEIDFIKDDELTANPPYLPLKERVRIVMDELNRVAEVTGKRPLYACNITGDVDEMEASYEAVVRGGGNGVMVSVNSVGFAGLAKLRSYATLPIHGHRNQWGMLTRHPLLGMSFDVYQTLVRLAGADQLHCNGIDSKFYEANESVARSIAACLQEEDGPRPLMPVLSSGQWAGSAVKTYQLAKTTDVMHLAGGGILAHPSGTKAGVRSMRQGWEAAVKGVVLTEYGEAHGELREAIEAFGGRR
ncbi:ribulose-bisphosphate carboxylase large subunit family protein [Shouchella sp. JSM 1781072]|uniref:ribulose-bisphosphate carboxylase large subunit family protein n=1 Tax=Shouchella sp. JSM 1781072 TaxID=3344581 RepID=UPI0035C02B56